MIPPPSYLFFFFFNDTATTEIYTLSLHDALPISAEFLIKAAPEMASTHYQEMKELLRPDGLARYNRSEEHTSELQSPCNLVCRLLLEKKKKMTTNIYCSYNSSA